MKVLLQIEEGAERGRQFAFDQPDNFVIGRAEEAHFRLAEDDPYVSRNHCVLEIRPPKVYLHDLGSTNGTYVNGVRCEEICVGDGDRITLGTTSLSIQVVSSSAPEPVEDDVACCLEPTSPGLEESHAGVAAEPCVVCGRTDTQSREAFREAPADFCPYLCASCAEAAQREVNPARIGEYRLLEEVGRGGMGVVYKAWHEPSARIVALKKLLPNALMDAKANLLFQREMAVLGQVTHTHIVRLLSQGTHGKEPYFTSQYVSGGDLGRLVADVRRSPLGVEESSRYIRQILSGLECIHEKGFVHRDVKPANILLDHAGPGGPAAKLSDFGLAKSFVDAGASCMTRRGEAGGTLLYMAPEQILTYRYAKPPADLYSLGVTFYYLTTGRLPFHFPSPLDRIRGGFAGRKFKNEIRIVLEDDPIPIRDQGDIPKGLAAVVDRSIRKKEEERFRSAGEMKDAIERAVCGGVE
jgi:hypothetical protein